MNIAADIEKQIFTLGSPQRAKQSARYFKTAPGEYGAHDLFVGVSVPDIRRLVRGYPDLTLATLAKLLANPVHEVRLFALIAMVKQYEQVDKVGKDKLFALYLRHLRRINNWDLVDTSAPTIIGKTIPSTAIEPLIRFAHSKNLWERRIAIVATFTYLREGRSIPTLRIAKLLLRDQEDLIHKAVGWALRELGKHVSLESEKKFLDRHASVMPRTMLRYAIERFPAEERRAYLLTGKRATKSHRI